MKNLLSVCVLSPHRDDAAFSCGLLLSSLLARSAKITIANFCTVSTYAPYLAETDELRTTQVTRLRAEEDGRFIECLASVTQCSPDRISSIDFAWQDAPVRRGIPEEQVLTAAGDEEERLSLVRELRKLKSHSLFLLPLGLGRHVDHLLVRDAARDAFSHETLLFYEDLPYACRQPASNSPEAAGLTEWLEPPAHLPNTKRDFALQYPSQIASDVADELESYANKLGGRERFYGAPQAVRTMSEIFQQQGVSA